MYFSVSLPSTAGTAALLRNENEHCFYGDVLELAVVAAG
jgi:hypothetical protein